MKRKVDVGSVFGQAQRISYEYMKLMNEKYNGSFNVLVVDDKDGLHSLSFLNHGAIVTMYEPNETYIKGGEIDGYTIYPITNRKYYNLYADKLKIKNTNFYQERIDNQYEFVFCYRSLHEKHNKDIPMKRKIRKLLSSVKENGYIYIFYHMAKNEKDISNFSKNQYLRKGEMQSYFDPKVWKIIYIRENNNNTIHEAHQKKKGEKV